MTAVRDAGHQIGLHGYTHENPADMTIGQQKIVDRQTTDRVHREAFPG